jgi:hypothetical protein
MVTMRTRFIFIGFLLLGVFSGFFFGYIGGIAIKTAGKWMLQNARENAEYGSPVTSVDVTIQTDEQGLLLGQLGDFAQKNLFAFRITRSLPPSSSYEIEMWREDIHIGGSYYPDSGKLGLGFLHNNFEQRPPQPIPLAVFDDAKNDLEAFISEIPSAIITEKQPGLIITTDKSWRNEQLLAQTKAVAEKYSLKYEFSFYASDRCLKVEILGEGFHVTADDCELDTIKDIDIEFFLDYHRSPSAKSKETLEKLFNELKSAFSNIENVTATEKP